MKLSSVAPLDRGRGGLEDERWPRAREAHKPPAIPILSAEDHACEWSYLVSSSPRWAIPANTTQNVNEPSPLSPAKLQNCEQIYSGGCFKPLHFGEVCYAAVGNWSPLEWYFRGVWTLGWVNFCQHFECRMRLTYFFCGYCWEVSYELFSFVGNLSGDF